MASCQPVARPALRDKRVLLFCLPHSAGFAGTTRIARVEPHVAQSLAPAMGERASAFASLTQLTCSATTVARQIAEPLTLRVRAGCK